MSNEGHQQQQVVEAQQVLKDLGLPKRQQNSRTALVLLSMLDLHPDAPWSACVQLTRGIRSSMEWMAEVYPDVRKGRNDPQRYAPNSRESIRKDSIHQLLAAGILEANSDDPGRAVNSSDYSYRPTDMAVTVLRQYGTPQWPQALETFRGELGSLRERWAAIRTSIASRSDFLMTRTSP